MSDLLEVKTPPREELVNYVATIYTNGTWKELDYHDRIHDEPAFKPLSIGERYSIIRQALLKKKQDAMKARQDAKRVKAASPKSNAKKEGKFKWRRLKNFQDYLISENGDVIGPAGTELKYRWDGGIPYVRIAGRDRKVYWLVVEAGFQESPSEKRERRAASKKTTTSDDGYNNDGYNDEDEAHAEDPESCDLDEDGNPVE